MEQICIDASATIITIITTLITIASAIANFVGKDTVIGKIVNFIALNIRKK